MTEKQKIVIVGAGEHGRMMYNFFIDSDKEVVAFAVEEKYRDIDSLNGLPVVDFEKLTNYFSPDVYGLFIAITYVNRNLERTRLYKSGKKMGYSFCSYIHPTSIVDDTAFVGENVAIFENCVIQYNAKIKNNVVIQAGSVIAHSSTINDNVWIAPCVAVAGFVNIGEQSFVGINSTIINNIEIAPDVIIGGGTVVTKDIDASGVYAGNPFRCLNKDTSGYLLR